MRKFSLLVVISLAGCGTQSPAPGHPNRLNPAGDYAHKATGFVFPSEIGSFKRSVVTEYNLDKTDVSAGYDKKTGEQGVASTIYVYPAPPLTSVGSSQSVIDGAREHLCTQAWEGIKADIVRAHPDAKLIVHETVRSPSPAFSRPGRRAVFRFTDIFASVNQPLRSEAELFCYAGGKWLVSYRTTAPAAFNYEPDLDQLMQSLKWPKALAD